MAKLLSFVAVASAAVAEGGTSRGGRDVGDGALTKADLERSTRRFIAERALTPRGDAAERRRLRTSSTQLTRHGAGSSSGDDDDYTVVHRHHHHDGYDDDDYYSSKGGKAGKGDKDWSSSGKSDKDWSSSGKSGSKSSKEGSGSKGGKGGGSGSGISGDDGKHELFYLMPSACPGECITSQVTGDTHEFMDSVRPCQEDAESHMWLVHSDGSYVMIESYDQPHMCVGVDYEPGDDAPMLAQTCYNGELVLRDCNDDYGTEWYFTGGQLVSAMCWGAGLSSMMTVFLEDDSGDEVQACRKEVAVWGANDEAVLKADTFLFVNRLPATPFVIDDVNEALEEYSEDNRMASSGGASGAGAGAGIAASVGGGAAPLQFDGSS